LSFNQRRVLQIARCVIPIAALGAMAIAAVALGAVQKRANATIAPGEVGSATAKCDPGQVVLAGGFGASRFNPRTSNGGPVARLESMPVSKSSFKTTGYNFNQSDPGTVFSYAYCGHRSNPPTVASSDVQVEPNNIATTLAKCPEGSRAISGGFGTDQLVISLVSKRSGNRGWKVSGFNVSQTNKKGSAEATLTAYALCKSPGPKLTTESQDTTVSNGRLTTTHVACPDGAKAVSGGFDGNIDASSSQLTAAGALASKRFDQARGWTTNGISTSQDSATLTTYTYCRG
jgi:hypothetical protein